MIFISKPRARLTTSRPMLPSPITPSVLPRNSVPRNFFFSHLPLLVEAMACGMERAMASIRPSVCSATETALPPGVFITRTPAAVAALRSTLSTPTPARPITFSLGALRSTSSIHLYGAPHQQRVGIGQVLRVFFRVGDYNVPTRLRIEQFNSGCGQRFSD